MMARSRTRLIARLDVKGPALIKGVSFEGLRVIGDPYTYATRYSREGADELLYLDTVATLYRRDFDLGVFERCTRHVFIPVTAAGGIKSVEDAQLLLNFGADRIAINTAGVCNPRLITALAEHFGSQCVVVSIEAKRQHNGTWEVYTNNGRERSGLDAVSWARHAVALGAGEILLTSVDQDGSGRGFDVSLCRAITNSVNAPVVISGGMGSMEHLSEVANGGEPDGIAMAAMLHSGKANMTDIRAFALSAGLSVRNSHPTKRG